MATSTIAGESLRRVAGVAAALEATALCVGTLGLINAWPILQPWLAVLLGINSGLHETTLDALDVVVAIDIVVLALAAVAFGGFWPGPGRPHKIWMGLSLAGIAVLIATGVQGRSGLMGGGIVLSALLIANPTSRPTGYVGGAANLFLLIGDFFTSGTRSFLVASLIGVGYLLLIIWFAWIGIRFLRPKTRAMPHRHLASPQ
jgi:hypothetical protein